LYLSWLITNVLTRPKSVLQPLLESNIMFLRYCPFWSVKLHPVANLQPIRWVCHDFGWINLLVHFFVQKCQVGPLIFLVSNWSNFLKIDVIWSFSLNLLKQSKKISPKLTIELCQLHKKNHHYSQLQFLWKNLDAIQ